MEVTFSSVEVTPSSAEVTQSLANAGILESVFFQPSGENGGILRFQEVSEDKHQEILSHLRTEYDENIVEERFDSIGPSVGQELKEKTVNAIIIALIAIILYITWAFRKISKPVASWKYGVIAVIALFHDVIIVLGIFAVLGKFYQVEITAPFIAALLTILGYSVNDTIVIFDRVRENLLKHFEGDLQITVAKSIGESVTRSVNSSLTTIFVLFAIFLLGGSTIRSFSLALIIGITIGTYSSLFLASPLLIVFEKFRPNRK